MEPTQYAQPITIRQARADDVGCLVRMWHRLQEHLQRSNTMQPLMAPSALEARREAFHRRLGDPSYQVLVAEAPRRSLVGMATGSILVDPSVLSQRQGILSSVWVEPKCRRLGVCRRIVLALLEFFQQADVNHLLLNYQSGNLSAEQTWHGLGFRDSEIEAAADYDALREAIRAKALARFSETGIVVRPATQEDNGHIASMFLAFRQHMAEVSPLVPRNTPESDSQLTAICRRWIEDPAFPSIQTVVGRSPSGLPISFAVGRVAEFEHEIPARQGHLGPVWVDQEHRRLGIGTHMVGRIVDQWADAAIQQVRAVSFPGDRPSEQASRALGFRPVDVFARANFPEVQDRLR